MMANAKSFDTSFLDADRDQTAMDKNHVLLIYAAAVAAKPNHILELGIGTGLVSEALLSARKHNGSGSLTCVDNELDFAGKTPSHFHLLRQDGALTLKISEQELLGTALDSTYDFLVSDADHTSTWVEKYFRVTTPGAICFFHDTNNPDFPNLRKIEEYAQKHGYSHYHFTESSRPDERCERGLLMVVNGKESDGREFRYKRGASKAELHVPVAEELDQEASLASSSELYTDGLVYGNKAYFNHHQQVLETISKPDILLQVATDPESKERINLTLQNHQAYCKQHDLQHTVINDGGAHFEVNWEKLRVVRDLLAKREGRYVFLLDADTMISQQGTNLRSALPEWAWLGMAIHPYPWPPQKPKQVWHYNCGAMYWRSCPQAISFLDAVLTERDNKDGRSEQCIINDLLLSCRKYQAGVVTLGCEWNANVHNQPHENAIVVAWHGASHRTARMHDHLGLPVGSVVGSADTFELAREYHTQHEQLRAQGLADNNSKLLRKAAGLYRTVLDGNPLYAPAMLGLMDCQAYLPEPNDNIALGRLACSLQPDSGEAHVLLACSLADENDARADHHFERGIACNPKWPNAVWNYGLWQLKTNRWREGLQKYRSGWWDKRIPRFYTPEWDGKRSCANLLVSTEQGFGDTLLYLRFLSLLARRYPSVTIYCEVYESFLPLLCDQAAFANIHFVQHNKPGWMPLSGVDEWVSLFTLPEILGLRSFDDLKECPRRYIEVDAHPQTNKRLRVGLRWRGTPIFSLNAIRSLPEDALEAFGGPDVDWVCLQDGPPNDALKWTSRLSAGNTWRDTARAIAALDLVVTTCTSIAHIAGVMGKPTILMLARPWHWYWGAEGLGSLWYDNMDTVAQEERGDWLPVLKKVNDMIEFHRQENE